MRTRLILDFTVLRRSLVLLPLLVAACGGNRNAIPTNVTNPDKFLYDRGTAALQEAHVVPRQFGVGNQKAESQQQQRAGDEVHGRMLTRVTYVCSASARCGSKQ